MRSRFVLMMSFLMAGTAAWGAVEPATCRKKECAQDLLPLSRSLTFDEAEQIYAKARKPQSSELVGDWRLVARLNDPYFVDPQGIRNEDGTIETLHFRLSGFDSDWAAMNRLGIRFENQGSNAEGYQGPYAVQWSAEKENAAIYFIQYYYHFSFDSQYEERLSRTDYALYACRLATRNDLICFLEHQTKNTNALPEYRMRKSAPDWIRIFRRVR